jgi:hypothetical protein
MRNLIVSFLLIFFFAFSAEAETQTVKQSRLRYDLAMGGFQASRATRLITYFGNTLYYDTAVELLAATPTEGVFGWAIDTNAMYFYTGAAWVAIGSASGILGTNGGTIGNETNNVWTFGENSEDLTLTFASDLVTFASGTSATFALTPASAFAGDVTLNGGAGALTFGAASSSVVIPDDSATGLVIGSTDRLDLLGFDTQDGVEKVIIKGTTTQTALHVDIGDVLIDEDITVTGDVGGGSATITGTTATGALTATSPAIMLHEIRFCGNGMDGATAHYMGPVALDDTEADLAVGAAGCDALDDATIGNVDAAVDIATNFAFKPVAMACSGICTGATAANDTVTFLLYDDTVSVADVTCNFTFAGDATANQCTVTDTSPATIAAGSLLAVEVAGTDDACSDAGDDFECLLYVTF